MKDAKRIVMEPEYYSATLSHLLTFAQHTQQYTEAGGPDDFKMNPVPDLPKLEFIGHCLTAILSGCANATVVKPYDRIAIAEMLETCAYHFRQAKPGAEF